MFRKFLGVLAAGIVTASFFAPAAAAADNPYGDPNLVSMFDGTDLSAWTSSKAGLWSAKNGVINGNGTARGWLYYNKTQVGTFRWIFNGRHGKWNHKRTVLVWCTTDTIRDAQSAI